MTDLRDRLLFQPWAISPEYANIYIPAIAAVLEGRTPFPDIDKSAWRQRNKTIFLNKMDTPDYDPGDDEFGDDEGEDIEEPVQEGSVAVMRLRGPVVKYSQFCGPRGTLDMVNELDMLRADTNITGAVLYIESGGGEFYAVKPLTDAILRFKAEKPIIALAGDYLCSAAYYIAAFCDEIWFEHPRAMIGCIGTYLTMVDMKPALEKLGVKFHEMYATDSTLKNKKAREALKGNYKPMITEMIDPINGDFTGDVQAQRGDKLAKNPAILKGETFFAAVALQLGMVDQQGDLQECANHIYELADKSGSTPPSSTQQTTDMKFENILALAGVAEPTQEQLDLANADLTAAGITNITLVQDSFITDASAATAQLTAANANVTKLTGELATANTSIATLTASNTTLQAKVKNFPATQKVEEKDPETEPSEEEKLEQEMNELPHMKALAGNPLFDKPAKK